MISTSPSRIKGILGLPKLSSDFEVFLLKHGLVVRQILNDSVKLLCLRIAYVSAFALLDLVLEVYDVLGAFSDGVLLLFDLTLPGRNERLRAHQFVPEVLHL